MLNGNIIGDGRMNLDWVENTLLSDNAKKVKLNKVKKNPFKKTIADSWYCQQCNIVIIFNKDIM
jgi:hypothetical protein